MCFLDGPILRKTCFFYGKNFIPSVYAGFRMLAGILRSDIDCVIGSESLQIGPSLALSDSKSRDFGNVLHVSHVGNATDISLIFPSTALHPDFRV